MCGWMDVCEIPRLKKARVAFFWQLRRFPFCRFGWVRLFGIDSVLPLSGVVGGGGRLEAGCYRRCSGLLG